MLRVWHWFRYYSEVLSLDVCLGVIGSGALAQAILKAHMAPAWWLLLPASVWVVYTADHLMDAHRSKGNSANIRHQFHYRNFHILAGLTIILAGLCLAGALHFLREIVFEGGLLVASFATMHLVLAFWGKVRFGKEMSVGTIYAFGVWFAPWLNRTVDAGLAEYLFFGLFTLAAWLNLFMTSVIEFRIDQSDGLLFVLDRLPLRAVRQGVLWVSLLATMAALLLPLLWAHILWPLAAVLAVLCAVPGVILLGERYFRENNRYRLLAEWVFSLGLLGLVSGM